MDHWQSGVGTEAVALVVLLVVESCFVRVPLDVKGAACKRRWVGLHELGYVISVRGPRRRRSRAAFKFEPHTEGVGARGAGL